MKLSKAKDWSVNAMFAAYERVPPHLDAHTYAAAAALNVALTDVTSEQRQLAKTLSFGYRSNVDLGVEEVTYMTTIEDCPHEDVARVVAGEAPSNALILYVRCMFSLNHKPNASLDELVDETIECCCLDDEPNARPVAVRIVEACDPDHLRGKKTPT